MNDSVALRTSFEINVLNPALYIALQRRFHDVKIAKPGVPLVGGAYVQSGSRVKFIATDDGEYYQVCCPFCAEDRYRLWINHRWGAGLDVNHPAYDSSDRFWWSCHCFNNGCMANPENVAQLRTWTYGGIGRELHVKRPTINAGFSAPAALNHVELPGTCVGLDDLPSHHIACTYLKERGYDPHWLGAAFGLHYCEEAPPEYPMTNGRIIIPIIMNGDLVGWQSRPPYECDWKAMHTPKYYNLPNMSRSLMLYGYDFAKQYPICIVTEGVTNVWTLGDGAVATFGKSMSFQQAEMIKHSWKAAVVAYDSDAIKESPAVAMMLESPDFPVVRVQLPEGEDPASIGYDRFMNLMYDTAHKANITLPEC